MVNKVILLGRLGNDPQMTTLNTGTKVVNISLATSESYKKENGAVVYGIEIDISEMREV